MTWQIGTRADRFRVAASPKYQPEDAAPDLSILHVLKINTVNLAGLHFRAATHKSLPQLQLPSLPRYCVEIGTRSAKVPFHLVRALKFFRRGFKEAVQPVLVDPHVALGHMRHATRALV